MSSTTNDEILKTYDDAIKELEVAVREVPPSSLNISEKLLDVLSVRDGVKQNLLPNVLESSANVKLKISELDRELRTIFKLINKRIKSKTKVEVIASLEDIKDLMEIESKDWWWHPEIYSFRFEPWVNLVCKLLTFSVLGCSLYLFFGVIYAWSNGFSVFDSSTKILTGISSFVGIVLSFLGIQSLFTDYIKNWVLDLLKKFSKMKFSLKEKPCYRSFIYSFGGFITLSISLLIFLLADFLNGDLGRKGADINNKATSQFSSSEASYEETVNQFKWAIKFYPNNKDAQIIQRNLANVYENLYDYDNAIIIYKALLPDLQATINLTRLTILKSTYQSKVTNNNYDDYIAHLIYLMQVSYNNYCIKYEYNNYIAHLIVDLEQIIGDDNPASKNMYYKNMYYYIYVYYYKSGDRENNAQSQECNYLNKLKATIKQPDKIIDYNKDRNFLLTTSRFLRTLGLARIYQGQYTKAEYDLERAIKLADMALKSNKKDYIWEIHRAQSSCLLYQALNKSGKYENALKYWKICSGYRPKVLEAISLWKSEYDFLSDLNLVKKRSSKP